MILITGANGQLGKKITQELEKIKTPLRLMVRNKEKVTVRENVEVVEGDYSDPDSLKTAFRGIDRAFIVSLHEKPMERAELHRNAFLAAAEAGVKYVVYTSYQGATADSTFSMGKDHYQSELYLEESGLTYTAVRNNFYMETAHAEVNAKGVILNPSGDGQVAWVCRDDIAQVVAHLLLNSISESRTIDVTGPEAPKLSELAHLFSDLSGIKIEFQEESYEDGLAWRKEYGLSEWNLEAWMTADMAKGKGDVSEVSNTVERLLGREACSLRDFYKQNPSYITILKENLS